MFCLSPANLHIIFQNVKEMLKKCLYLFRIARKTAVFSTIFKKQEKPKVLFLAPFERKR